MQLADSWTLLLDTWGLCMMQGNSPIISQAHKAWLFASWQMVVICAWEKPVSIITPYKLPPQGRVQERYNIIIQGHFQWLNVPLEWWKNDGGPHFSRHWRSVQPLLQMLPVTPSCTICASRPITSWRWRTSSNLKITHLPQHLQEHDYLWTLIGQNYGLQHHYMSALYMYIYTYSQHFFFGKEAVIFHARSYELLCFSHCPCKHIISETMRMRCEMDLGLKQTNKQFKEPLMSGNKIVYM